MLLKLLYLPVAFGSFINLLCKRWTYIEVLTTKLKTRGPIYKFMASGKEGFASEAAGRDGVNAWSAKGSPLIIIYHSFQTYFY